jgi:hypothetical protein
VMALQRPSGGGRVVQRANPMPKACTWVHGGMMQHVATIAACVWCARLDVCGPHGPVLSARSSSPCIWSPPSVADDVPPLAMCLAAPGCDFASEVCKTASNAELSQVSAVQGGPLSRRHVSASDPLDPRGLAWLAHCDLRASALAQTVSHDSRDPVFVSACHSRQTV